MIMSNGGLIMMMPIKGGNRGYLTMTETPVVWLPVYVCPVNTPAPGCLAGSAWTAFFYPSYYALNPLIKAGAGLSLLETPLGLARVITR